MNLKLFALVTLGLFSTPATAEMLATPQAAPTPASSFLSEEPVSNPLSALQELQQQSMARPTVDAVRESEASAQRLKEARRRLALYKQQAAVAEAQQKERYRQQQIADQRAAAELQKIRAETRKYEKDLAIQEFNKRRSEIALAYANAKVQRAHQRKRDVVQKLRTPAHKPASARAGRK